MVRFASQARATIAVRAYHCSRLCLLLLSRTHSPPASLVPQHACRGCAHLLTVRAVSCAFAAAATHVPSLVYPSCFSDYDVLGHYVVVNSGITSREAHDHNNSLQNPHLPDWAIVDITTPPSRLAPGKIAAADFFDESWQLK